MLEEFQCVPTNFRNSECVNFALILFWGSHVCNSQRNPSLSRKGLCELILFGDHLNDVGFTSEGVQQLGLAIKAANTVGIQHGKTYLHCNALPRNLVMSSDEDRESPRTSRVADSLDIDEAATYFRSIF